MALPPLVDLLALLPDNTVGDISAEDMRTITTELYNGIESGGGSGSGGGVPVGTVIASASATVPNGYLLCDGQLILRSQYPALFTAIGVIYGAGDGATTFALPDYRGRFLRAVSGESGRDPDAASRLNRGDGVIGNFVGTTQVDEFKSHDHGIAGTAVLFPTGGSKSQPSSGNRNELDFSANGGAETRPTNIYVQYLIFATAPTVIPESFLSDPFPFVSKEGCAPIVPMPHGLDSQPLTWGHRVKCVTAFSGWNAGDVTTIFNTDSGSFSGVSITADDTNLSVKFPFNEALFLYKPNSEPLQLTDIDAVNFEIMFFAKASF